MGAHSSHFQKEERDQLEVLLKTGISKQSIADILGKDRSAIYREIAKRKSSSAYSSTKAQKNYLNNRSKPVKLQINTALKAEVINLLKKKYSPGQIILSLKKK
ncbi:MAG: helix-turn-helix domain-containing protein, partial [Gammaproteobacteria bacterium]|nr:helix-turn-helix domain-containing protein [Gammaproteobacteria bacterium]